MEHVVCLHAQDLGMIFQVQKVQSGERQQSNGKQKS